MTLSTDGHLEVLVDEGWAGVLLVADFSAEAAPPRRATFTRTGPDGVPVLVRSGDNGHAPGGIGFAYDHEAPLDVPVTYTVTGGEAASAPVTVTIPLQARTAWLKSITDPGLSRLVDVVDFSDVTHAIPTGVFQPEDAELPIVVQGRQQGLRAQLVLRSRETPEAHDELQALLKAGTLLLQASAQHGIPDLYLRRDDLRVARPWGTGWARRLLSVPVMQVKRPSTVGAPLRIPGWSWDDLVAQYGSWDAVKAAFPTWRDLIRSRVA